MKPSRKRKKTDEALLERVWTHRETVVYPELFGEPASDNIFTLTTELFTSVFEQKRIDPLWGNHGVMWFRSGDVWTAVTSGMSNPWWDDHANPDGESGMGLELAIQCRSEEVWATGLLQRLMAYQLLIGAGRFPGTPLLGEYARVSGGPLTKTSALISVMMVPRPELTNIRLESGTFNILQVVPIAAAELSLAKAEGGAVLLGRLAEAGVDRVVDLERASVV